jgi:hypothetical protein
MGVVMHEAGDGAVTMCETPEQYRSSAEFLLELAGTCYLKGNRSAGDRMVKIAGEQAKQARRPIPRRDEGGW